VGKEGKEGKILRWDCSVDCSSDKVVSGNVGRVGTTDSEGTGWARGSDP